MRYSRKHSSKTATKQELIKYLAHTNNLTSEQVTNVLDSIVNFIKGSLMEGSDVSFLNLFTIHKVHQKPTKYAYTHLKTGELCNEVTEPKWKLKFKTSNSMQRFLDNNYDDIR
jgi:nucleoid DNA-binding protein